MVKGTERQSPFFYDGGDIKGKRPTGGRLTTMPFIHIAEKGIKKHEFGLYQNGITLGFDCTHGARRGVRGRERRNSERYVPEKNKAEAM